MEETQTGCECITREIAQSLLPHRRQIVHKGNAGRVVLIGGSFGMSRFDSAQPFAASSYATPGWQRAQANMAGGFKSREPRREGLTIEGELIAKSTSAPSVYKLGERVFHLKFGYGQVSEVDGNKLTVDFDKAGRKKVVDSFVERG